MGNGLKILTPPEAAECLLVGMVNNTYQELSIKNNTKNQRGDDHIKRVIEGFEQHMPAGKRNSNFQEMLKTKKKTNH